MTDAASDHGPPAGEPRAPGWLKIVNPISALLVRRGIGPAPQHLLAVPGRRSGVLRTTPVAVVTVDGSRYVVAGFAASDWVQNARAAGWGTLTRGRDSQRVKMIEIPPDQRSPILREYARKVRGGRSFIGVGAGASREELDRASDQHPIFLAQHNSDPN